MSFLIKNCELFAHQQFKDGKKIDVRVLGDRIIEIGPSLNAESNETIIDANGGLLLPGLHDHHIHLVSLAAARASVQCGPPEIDNQQQLEDRLCAENLHTEQGWLRGIGYHDSIAGNIDRHWLDRHIPNRPCRIQHRGGRQWIINTLGLEQLGLLSGSNSAQLPAGIEYNGELPTGRLYECDRWLRSQLKGQLPNIAETSQLLASYGVTGITDTTPANGPEEWQLFNDLIESGQLVQNVRMMGSHELPSERTSASVAASKLSVGEFKIHLLESQLPDIDTLVDDIRKARSANRNVAIHCVTNLELVYALSCLESAGVESGDRIEHSSVTNAEMLDQIREMGLRIVSQPHFIFQRGEQYLQDVDAVDQPWLYRLRSFVDADVPLAAGSDAPFGLPNPWISMQAATDRMTSQKTVIGKNEALSPEQALGLYLSSAENPGLDQREIAIGETASLCLLSSSWAKLRNQLADAKVAATWVNGKLVYQKLD